MKTLALFWLIMIPGFFAQAQELRTDIRVHDPVMIRQDSVYYIFCTGRGIAAWSSTDRLHWKAEKPVFATAPQWAVDAVPSFKNYIWAPDISFSNGKYYLFYAVSTFGKNISAIGLATNSTLHPADATYQWVDHGLVIQSVPGKTNWNAIDPNLITDNDGTPYLAFGSFWDGLKLVQLSQDRLHLAEDLSGIPTIASRKKEPSEPGNNAIEAPFIFKHDKYFYLFASIDYCCKGPASTYKMIIGRAKNIKGPYLDEQGIRMDKGGGTVLLAGDDKWYGVGHNAVCTFDGEDYLVFHGYDAEDKATPKLRVEKLKWTKGWPVVMLNKTQN